MWSSCGGCASRSLSLDCGHGIDGHSPPCGTIATVVAQRMSTSTAATIAAGSRAETP